LDADFRQKYASTGRVSQVDDYFNMDNIENEIEEGCVEDDSAVQATIHNLQKEIDDLTN